ncbi:MAG: hypothetical protein IPK50_07740 [Fibrobacterota bacterium]|nr:MAG: hypothetical protein IPK50_07740 [Fibrobacterota bacterium]
MNISSTTVSENMCRFSLADVEGANADPANFSWYAIIEPIHPGLLESRIVTGPAGMEWPQYDLSQPGRHRIHCRDLRNKEDARIVLESKAIEAHPLVIDPKGFADETTMRLAGSPGTGIGASKSTFTGKTSTKSLAVTAISHSAGAATPPPSILKPVMSAMYTGTKVEFYTGTTLNGTPCNSITVQQFVNLPSAQGGLDGFGTSVKFQIGPEGFLANPKAAWPADGKIFLACLFTAKDPKAICPRNDALNDWNFPQIGSASNYVAPSKQLSPTPPATTTTPAPASTAPPVMAPPTQHTLPTEGIAKQVEGYLYSQEVDVKAGGTAFDVQIDLGLAGGNQCWFFFGESPQYERGNVCFENWRKVEYELIYPSIMSYAFEKNSRGHMDFSSDIRSGIEKIFKPVFIDVSCLGSQAITDEEACGLVANDDDLSIDHNVCGDTIPLGFSVSNTMTPSLLSPSMQANILSSELDPLACSPGARPRFLDCHQWPRSKSISSTTLLSHQVRIWASHVMLDDQPKSFNCTENCITPHTKYPLVSFDSSGKYMFAATKQSPAPFEFAAGIWSCEVDPSKHQKKMRYAFLDQNLFAPAINTPNTCRISEVKRDGTEGEYKECHAATATDLKTPENLLKVNDLVTLLATSSKAFEYQGEVLISIAFTDSTGVKCYDLPRNIELASMISDAFSLTPDIPIHPGLDQFGSPRSGSMDSSWIGAETSVTMLEISLPGKIKEADPPSLGEIVGVESEASCPIRWDMFINLVYGFPGISIRGKHDLLLSMCGSTLGTINLIAHELGHKMGMAPFVNGTDDRVGNAPGMPTPLHIDNGGTFYCNGSINSNGLRNNDQVGAHCAFKPPKGGSICAMFGTIDLMNSSTSHPFCPKCQSYLNSRNLSDITSEWILPSGPRY